MAELGPGNGDRTADHRSQPCGTTTGCSGFEDPVSSGEGRQCSESSSAGDDCDLALLYTSGTMGKPFYGRAALRLLEAERVTVLRGVPTMFHLLMRDATFDPTFTTSQFARSGTSSRGGSVSEALGDRVRGWCDVDVAVRGPNVMPGCARMPAETRRSYRRETILRSGDSDPPREANDQLRAHPAVDNVCVIGVPHDILGELVCACIVGFPISFAS